MEVVDSRESVRSEARDIHAEAEEARERGDFPNALELTDRATIEYQRKGDILGMAEIQSSRFLTLRHLFEQTNDRNYLILASHSAMAGVEIARQSGNEQATAIPLFNLAKAQETLGNLQEAVGLYREAVAVMTDNPPQEHNRNSVLKDMEIHLYICEYRNGDKSALVRAEKATLELESSDDPSKYNKDVWVSGAYMKIGEALKTDDPEKSRKYFDRAKSTIDANPELALREQQLERITQA